VSIIMIKLTDILAEVVEAKRVSKYKPVDEIALQKFKNDIVAHNKGTVLKIFPRNKNKEAWRYQLRYNIDLTDIKEFDKKYKKGIKSYHKSINEDWFDDYLVYEKKVFDELKKRFKINQRIEDDLSAAFGIKLEKGFKKNIPAKKLAFALVPRGKAFNITRWGNA